MKKTLMAAALALAAQGAMAAPATVDFENFSTTAVMATVSSGGFTFTPASGALAVMNDGQSCGPSCAANGTETLIMGGNNVTPGATHPMTMASDTMQNFFLLGLDYAEFIEAGNPANATSIVLTGNLAAGGTVTQTLLIDGLNDGPGGNNDFQSAVLAAFWATSELSSLEFAGFTGQTANQSFQVDNIQVDTNAPVQRVPEPGSLALLSAALLGLAGLRRRMR